MCKNSKKKVKKTALVVTTSSETLVKSVILRVFPLSIFRSEIPPKPPIYLDKMFGLVYLEPVGDGDTDANSLTEINFSERQTERSNIEY